MYRGQEFKIGRYGSIRCVDETRVFDRSVEDVAEFLGFSSDRLDPVADFYKHQGEYGDRTLDLIPGEE